MASKNSDTTPSSPEPPRPRKILVVDDSEDGAEMLATLLRFAKAWLQARVRWSSNHSR